MTMTTVSTIPLAIKNISSANVIPTSALTAFVELLAVDMVIAIIEYGSY